MDETGPRNRHAKEIDYMDKEEQLNFINQLKFQNEQSNRTYRMAFSGLAVLLAIGKFYMFLCQIFFPFQTGPHSSFIDIVYSQVIVVAEFLSAVSFGFLFFYIKPVSEQSNELGYAKRKIQYWWLGLILPVLPLIYIWFSLEEQSFLVLVWFGLGNVGLAFLYWFGEWSMMDTTSQILTLHNYTYDLKTV